MKRWQAVPLYCLLVRQSPSIIDGDNGLRWAKQRLRRFGSRHFQRLIIGKVRAIMPRGGSASAGPEPGQGFMDLLRIRGKVGKHCPGSKDGYTVRGLETSSKVVIGSPAYLAQV